MKYSSDLAGEAYIALRERILHGDIAIGEVISRRKIAAELGMSFLPVSEAFVRLEVEGLLESKPRVGTRVRIPTPEDVRGQFRVRTVLEVEAARLFSEVATPAERAELLKLAARVDALYAQSSKDRSYYLNMHETLHRRIAECAGCPALSHAIERTHALSSTWLCGSKTFSPNLARLHQDLMEVLVRGDAEAAGQAMREHVSGSMNRALERLEPYFRAHKTQQENYSRKPRKEFAVFSIAADHQMVEGNQVPACIAHD